MYIPVADHVGYAFQHAAGYLTKRAEEEPTKPFELTHTQWVTVYWIEACIIVLLFTWNLWLARSIIFPFKLCAVACHEGCHALAGLLTGAKVKSIVLDPNQGGTTRMVGGFAFCSLPAGYIGSTLIGSSLLFASFDQKASKIAAIPLFVHLTIVSLWARHSRFTLLNVTFIQGLILIFYIVAHAVFLRFLLALIGCMNVMYSVWDQLDDLVFHAGFATSPLSRNPTHARCPQKINESDVCAFQRLYPWLPAQVWGAIWTFVSCSGLTAAILGGIVTFKKDFAAQYFESQTFIPT